MMMWTLLHAELPVIDTACYIFQTGDLGLTHVQ